MVGRVATGLLVIGLALTGCTSPGSDPGDVVSRTQSLWSARTSYTGDNSRVAALVGAVGFGGSGAFSIELETQQPPYGVTVAVRDLGKPFESVDFAEQATLLLGLVSNLDHVAVTSGTQRYALTAAEASKKLGFDVKDLGRDQQKLSAYLERQRD